MLSLDPITEAEITRYVPTGGPELVEWCRLDTLHRIALSNMDNDLSALRAAVRLADAKYQCWLRSVGRS